MVPKTPLSSFGFTPKSPSIIFASQKSGMEHVVSRSEINMTWPPRKGGRDRFATTNVRAYSVTTVDNVVNICDVRCMLFACSLQRRASQVEQGIPETSSIGTRTTLTAGTRTCVASQVYLERDHVVTDAINVFLVTIASHAGRRGAKSNRKVRQSSKFAEVYLQLARDQAIIGDLYLTKVLHGKPGTTATPGNFHHSSEKRTHAAFEAVDPDATIDFSRISVRMEDRRREPRGLGPLLGLLPPRIPDFSEWLPTTWFPLHHPGPATASPLMRGRRVRGLRAQTPRMTSRREGRPTESTPPVRRNDHAPPPATPGWRLVGTQVTPVRVVPRERGIAGALKPRRLGGRHGELRAHGKPGGRYGAPSALAAPRPQAPTGLQHHRCSLQQRERSTPPSSRPRADRRDAPAAANAAAYDRASRGPGGPGSSRRGSDLYRLKAPQVTRRTVNFENCVSPKVAAGA
ncbi:hypothetical protein MTO96_004889 [Rhipicephalus appendiculatus]